MKKMQILTDSIHDQRWLGLLLFCGSFMLYLLTASHGVTQGDTGEFIAAAAVGGVPHEPGYPLYSFLSREAYLLPFGNPALQVNALSGLFAALAIVFVYKIIRLLTNNTTAALFGAVSLATYESFWFYALVAEIHTLHILLLSAFFFYLIQGVQGKKPNYFLYASFIFGLGVANNQTIIFVLPAFVSALFFTRKELTKKVIVLLFVMPLFGLLLYGYTYVAASQRPPINWGEVHDTASFLHVFLREDFGSVFLGNPEPPAPFQFHSFVYLFQSIFRTSWYLIPFMLLAFGLIKKLPKAFTILLLGFVCFGPFYYALINTPIRSVVHQANIEQYIAYPFFFLSIFSGLGVAYLLARRHVSKSLYATLAVLVFFVFPFMVTFQKVRQDNDQFVAKTSQFMLSEVPKNGILLLWSDSLTMPAEYLMYAKQYRPDITIIQLGLLNASWYQSEITRLYPGFKRYIATDHIDYNKICTALASKNNLYLYPWYQEFDGAFGKKCTLIPYGLIVKIVPTKAVPSVEKVIAYNAKIWHDYVMQVDPAQYIDRSVRTREGLFYLSEQLNYSGIYYLRNKKVREASSLFSLAYHISADQTNAIVGNSALLAQKGNVQQAINILENGVKRNPTDQALYKNLGVLYLKVNDRTRAYYNFKQYLAFSPADPDVPSLLQFVTDYESAAL